MNKEICWNIVNSALAMGLVFLGGLSTGIFSWQTVGVSLIAGLVVGLSQFRDYWASEKEEYRTPDKLMLFKFI
jgi:hypothetical protein